MLSKSCHCSDQLVFLLQNYSWIFPISWKFKAEFDAAFLLDTVSSVELIIFLFIASLRYVAVTCIGCISMDKEECTQRQHRGSESPLCSSPRALWASGTVFTASASGLLA